MTILVATSGDTGGAVAAAFHLRPWVRVVILYPKGMVSARQEQQLTCWGDNVISLRIDGTFDDCQRLVKEAFVDFALQRASIISAPRTASTSAACCRRWSITRPRVSRSSGAPGRRPPTSFRRAISATPSPRSGRGRSGFPIERIVLAHNANRTVPDYLRDGEWRPRPSMQTLASAMDVGNPSNMERMRALYPTFDAITEQLSADSVDDATIRRRIGEDFMQFGREWCPHTATAAEVYRRLSERERRDRPWVLVATAHPAKFNDVVEPIIGKPVEVPRALGRLLEPAAAHSGPAAHAEGGGRGARMNDLRHRAAMDCGGRGDWCSSVPAAMSASAPISAVRGARRCWRAWIASPTKRRIRFWCPTAWAAIIHIDHLLLTPRGILVLDTRRVAGLIFGGDQMSDWTVMGRSRFTFDNPQPALYDRIAAVKALAGDFPSRAGCSSRNRASSPRACRST